MIKSFKPDIVIVQLGSNDLTSETALRVGASKDDFLRLLHDLYHVQVIYVCQTIMRQGQPAFNHKAKLLTKYLRVVLRPVAQLVERRAVTREVVSSTPAGPSLRVSK